MRTPRPLVIVGAGGFGRGVNDVVDAINALQPTWRLLGYLDDSPDAYSVECAERRNVEIRGPLARLESLPSGTAVVVGIANAPVRRQIDARIQQAGLEAVPLVHPAATVTDSAVVGPGSVICAGARVASNVQLGRHVHMNLNATAGHDVGLADFVSVFPQAALSGFSRMGAESTLGSHAVVLPGITVGPGVNVGAGAVVVHDVEGNRTVKGVPAR